MAATTKESIKPAVIGAFAGAVGLAILALSSGWAVTGNTAMEMAEKREGAAVIAALTPICVAQFMQQGDDVRTDKLTALSQESSWKQDDYVVAQGWATMPGSASASSTVAEACAAELLKAAKG